MKQYSIIIALLALVTLTGWAVENHRPLEVKELKLNNGLTVWLNEDHSQPKVYGALVVKAGAKDCPNTGIAHYLEHVLFKGTQRIGTVDYKEEKVWLDFKIFFPKLPETTKWIAIYGVPNWQLRGAEFELNRHPSGEWHQAHIFKDNYDNVPEFHHPKKIVDAKDYDKDNFFTWSEYTDAHLIKPIQEGTMAMWLTPEATYVAVSTEMNWRREYFGRGGNTILMDQSGHQYKCKGVMDYPDDTLFWVQGMSGDYFAIVLIFEPLPLSLATITYIVPEGEPFKANFANWSGEVRPDLNIKELRDNQKLFDYFPRKVVE